MVRRGVRSEVFLLHSIMGVQYTHMKQAVSQEQAPNAYSRSELNQKQLYLDHEALKKPIKA